MNDREQLLQEQRERKQMREQGFAQEQSVENAIQARAKYVALFFYSLMDAGFSREESLFLTGHSNL